MPSWIRDYKPEWLRLDVVAGLVTAAVVIPKAMAYATIAGLPVEAGLYTAFIPLIIYALVGTSRPLSVTTTTTLAILAGAQISELAKAGDPAAVMRAAATLTLLTGLILVAASTLRLGFVANFISEPVLVGFKAGIGIVIVFDQIPKLLGIHIEKSGFFRNIARIVEALPETSIPTLVVGITMMAILVGLHHFAPKLPAPLIAVAAGIAGTAFLGLKEMGVSIVGHIPTGLPSLTLPDFSLVEQLWPAALGIALMSFTETIAAGRAFAKSGEPTPQANRELFATGIANAGGALLGAMPGGGGTSQTAVNRTAGAQSQLAGVVTAAATLVTMLFLAPMIGLMPNATLAAVVIVYSVGLVQPKEFKDILSVRRLEFVWALSACAGVIMLGTLKGILVAIIVSLVGLAQQVADPPVAILGRKRGTNVFRPRSDEHPDDETFPGMLLIRFSGRIFFANAERLAQKLKPIIEEADPKVIVFDMRAVPDLEYTALKMLIEGERRNRGEGRMLWLVGLNPEVLEMVQRSALGETLGRERLMFNLETAVAQYTGSAAPQTNE
ncbi:MAG: sulfate permease [Thermoanaerobaculia bacterium]|jgi:high affinity sulfate transporter 1